MTAHSRCRLCAPTETAPRLPAQYQLHRAGTDDIGRSANRANLRRLLELDRSYIAHAAIAALANDGKMTGKHVAWVAKRYKIDVDKVNPDGA